MLRDKRSFLTKVKISGYKSIGSASFSQTIALGRINIIIGANGAGKSNFISFFKMLNFMMNGRLQFFIGKSGYAEKILHFGSKRTPVLEAKLSFENENFSNEYDFSLVKSLNDTMIFSEESLICGKERYGLSGGQKESYLFSEYLSHNNEKALKAILNRCRVFQFHDTSDSSGIRSYSDISNSDCLMSDAGNIAAFLYRLKNESESTRKFYNRIVSYVRLAVPQFDDFVLEPDSIKSESILLKWREKDNSDYVLGVSQLSDGSLRFVALATLLLQPADLLPNVILIDEPELGLHPQAVNLLAAMMKKASENSQIIVATQSPRLLDSFEPEQIIVAQNDSTSHCTVFQNLKSDELEIWLSEYSLSQLWDKNILGGQPE